MGRPLESTDSYDAFTQLVRQMRELGAVRVRDGAMEVAFAEPPSPPVPSEPERQVRSAMTSTERDELEDLRRYKRMAEEIP